MARPSIRFHLGLLAYLGLSVGVRGQGFVNHIRFQDGAGPAINGNRFEIPSSRGQKVGGNLFHSFSDFSVAGGSSAVFKAPPATANIIARVSGGNPSAINGTLRAELENSSALSSANLYLLNPSGILFGPNAKLELGGSFTASTAGYVKLKDGGRFDARDPARDILTTAPISAFGFLGTNAPAAVHFAGSRLSVPAGRNLSVIAGDTTIESGAQLLAPSGALSFFSTAAAGELLFDEAAPAAHFADTAFTAFGRFSLSGGSSARIDGAGGGLLSIRAATLTLEGSSVLSSANSGATAGGDMKILADRVSVLGGSRIAASALAAGKAGDVHVQAGQLTVDGVDGVEASSIRSRAEKGLGDGGNLDVRALAIVLSNSGYLSNSTYSAGDGGNMNVTADSLDIHGATVVGGTSGIVANAYSGSSGAGGAITLQAGTISIKNGGEISASTFSSGLGGSLYLQANSLKIDGSASPSTFNGIAVNSNPGATGNGGSLRMDVAGAVTILGKGEIAANTFSRGHGGDLFLRAGSLMIDGSATPTRFTGIAAQSAEGALGNGGRLEVSVVGAVTITGAAEITANTFSPGHGGDLSLRAHSLLIDGSATLARFTGITVDSNTGASGNAGNLTLNIAGSAVVTGHGQISASTHSSGHGGDLSFRAGSLVIDGSATPTRSTGISVDSKEGATGDAGSLNIHIEGDAKIIGAGQITGDTFTSGKGGNLILYANTLTIDGAQAPEAITGISTEAAAGTGHGGNITIHITASARIFGTGVISTSTSSSGTGGNLHLDAGSLLIDGSANQDYFTGILTEASDGTGNAGSLDVHVADLARIVSGGGISSDTYTSGRGGNLTFRAGSLVIHGATTPELATGISANAQASTGHAGDVVVQISGAARLVSGGAITADTFASGNGGALRFQAQELFIDGTGAPDGFTGISTVAQEGTGSAGDLSLKIAGLASFTGGGKVTSDTYTSGKGGSLAFQAGSLLIQGTAAPNGITGITANSRKGTGDAGDLKVEITKEVIIREGGEISASTFNTGHGGKLTLAANSLTIEGSSVGKFSGLTAQSNPGSSGKGGDLFVQIAKSVHIGGGGTISAGTFSSGPGGNLTLAADSLTIDGSSAPGRFTGLSAQAGFGSSGHSGDLFITVAKGVTIGGGGEISAGTFGSGHGGKLTLAANSLTIEGSSVGKFTGITAQSNAGASGNGGDLFLKITKSVHIGDGGTISAGTFSSGQGGDLILAADSLTIHGSSVPGKFTGLSAQAGSGSSGNSGDLFISVAHGVIVGGGGQISAGTFGSGNGGNLTLTANSLAIDGSSAFEKSTGLSAQSNPGASGNGGDLFVKVTKDVTIKNGGQISTTTFGSGQGGNLTLAANLLVIDGSPALGRLTGLTAQANFGATGAAGNLAVNARDIRLLNNGKISSDSLGLGDGGSVHVTASRSLTIANRGIITAGSFNRGEGGDIRVIAGSLAINGSGAPGQFTGISAQSNDGATGNAGTVRINAGQLALVDFGEIASASFGRGRAGSVEVNVAGGIVLSHGSYITSTSIQASAGSVAVSAGGNIEVDASFITVRADRGNAGNIVIATPATLGLQRSSVIASAKENGGGITLRAGFFDFNRSTVTANAVNGNGGRITLDLPAAGVFGDARDFVLASPFILQSSDSRISASSTFGLQGALLISAPFVDLAGSLEALPSLFFDASSELREKCLHKLGRDFSTYLRLGRGGQAEQPDELGVSY